MRSDPSFHKVRTRRTATHARSRLPGMRLLFALAVLPLLHGAMAQAADGAPWRALYRGDVGSEAVWIDMTLVTMPGDDGSRDGSDTQSANRVEAKIVLPDSRTVLFGEGSGSADGGVHLSLRDDTDGRPMPGRRGAPGAAVGELDALRSMAANDDGRTLEGTIDLSGTTHSFAAHRTAQYAYLNYQLGSVQASLALPDFHGGTWQAIDEPLWQAETGYLRSFASEGRTDYIAAMVWHGWFSHSDTTVQGVSDDHLSLLSARSTYTGGAHGNLTYVARTYVATPAGPRPVELAALLSAEPSARAALVDHVLAALRAQDATWVVQGEVDTLSEQDLSLFSLTPQGLQFVFPPYAMGSYAEGTYTVLVPYDVARGWAPPDGLIARLWRRGLH